MSTHTSLPDFTKQGIKELEDNYNLYEADFFEFFPQLQEYVDGLNKS